MQRINEVSMRLVLSKFNLDLFIADLKIVRLGFRNFLLHCSYMGGILTGVRACPEAQFTVRLFYLTDH